MSDSSQFIVVAIDGPAASGKSSAARRFAQRSGFSHINSGLMYRAATRAVLDAGIAPDDPAAIALFFKGATVVCEEGDGGLMILINGEERGGLASDEINANVSSVARVPEVRQIMVTRQRELAARNFTVMEGRDIGSVVFPDTPFKFYVDASEEVRALRRSAQGLTDFLAERDRADSTRKSSPLVIPGDACVIDSSELTVDEVVDKIFAVLREKGAVVTG